MWPPQNGESLRNPPSPASENPCAPVFPGFLNPQLEVLPSERETMSDVRTILPKLDCDDNDDFASLWHRRL